MEHESLGIPERDRLLIATLSSPSSLVRFLCYIHIVAKPTDNPNPIALRARGLG